MFKDKKKIVLFLGLGLIILALGFARSGEDSSKQSDEAVEKPNSWPAGTNNFTVESPEKFDTGEMFARMMLAVVIVFALGAAAVYLSKRLGKRIANIPGRELRLIESLYLGSRRSVHLLRVGDKRILIGSTAQNITKLAELPCKPTGSSEADEGQR